MRRRTITFWPPIPPAVYLRRSSAELPYPFSQPGCRLFRMGRHALWHGVRSLPLTPGDQVLVPAYHHGSEVEALSQAGLFSRFYEATADLAPDPDELEKLITPDVKALYLIHYLGFPQDVLRWRRWCDERDLLLIEDAAMAWPGHASARPLGSHGDVAIFSPWKSVGLREIGALLVREPVRVRATKKGRLAPRTLLTAHGAWLAQRTPILSSKPPPAGKFDERDFALGDPWMEPTKLSLWLLRRLYSPQAVARRRANFEWLRDRLAERVPAPFVDLPAGISPAAFPVLAADRSSLRASLAHHGIEAVELWSHPHPSLPVDRFPSAARRRLTSLALPVHQGLGRRELEVIAGAVDAAPIAPPPPGEVETESALPAAMAS